MNTSYQGEKYKIEILTNNIIRLQYSEEGYFHNEKTQIVYNRNFDCSEDIRLSIEETNEKINIYSENFNIYYTKNGMFSKENFYIDFSFDFAPYGNRWHFGDSIETLKGTVSTLDMLDGAMPLEEGIISKKGFSILDDSKSHFLDKDDEVVIKEFESTDIYIFAHGQDYLRAIKDYYNLTGMPPLLPRFALGNWWSRFWAYSEESLKDLVNAFEYNQIPLSVLVIDMDWHKTNIPSGYGSGWTGYSWEKELFPNPPELMKWIREKGLRLTLNLHPADGIRAYEDSYPRIAERLGLNQEIGEPALFNFTEEKFRKAYFEEVLHPLEADGVDFWWIDWQQWSESEIPYLSPLWLQNHYHSKDLKDRGKPQIILSRYSGPGSHRYPIGFSGDTVSTWESLRFQPYMTTTASNIGYSWWSHDIGGHMMGKYDEELTVRWIQFGVFSPIMRLHSSGSPFTGKEPWKYSKGTLEIIAKFLRIRHQLIPYIYSMNVLNHTEGRPLLLPMYYTNPESKEAYEFQNEYTFGTELIVQPITNKMYQELNLSGEKVYLPKGDWYDVWTNKRYKGNQVIKVFREIDSMPVFAKSGAIIPLDQKSLETKGMDLPEKMAIKIYPGKSNVFTLFESKGDMEAEIKFELDFERKKLKISVEDLNNIIPREREITLLFCGTERFKIGDFESNYSFEKQELSISLEYRSIAKTPMEIDITGFEMVKKQDVSKMIFDRLYKANIEFNTKEMIWDWFNLGDIELFNSNLFLLENKIIAEALYEIVHIAKS